MSDLSDGQSVEVKGSGSSYYTLKNVGGVYSCSEPDTNTEPVINPTSS